MTAVSTTAGRVAVAMSGGVDSSVAAALLIEEGYDVVGLTMQIGHLSSAHAKHSSASSMFSSTAESAAKTASALGIPHHVVDLTEVFHRCVVESFVEEYSRGRTPNPCVRCNRFVKFEALLGYALELGAEHLATGHYARIHYDEGCGRWLLKRAADGGKDQSYALYALTQGQLAHLKMPLGCMTKDETRRLAASCGLSAADRPESQEICFVTDEGYRTFLKDIRPDIVKPGPILDTQGKTIGEHMGIAFYTVGQRRGLGIAAREPLYVVSLDADRNAVIVGREPDLYSRSLIAVDVNMISMAELDKSFAVTAKVRYNMQDAPAVVGRADGQVSVTFDEPQRAVTPGQAVVWYEGENVVGGGTIERTANSA